MSESFLARIATAIVILSPLPGLAADFSRWIDRPSTIEALTELAQQPDRCCKHCTKGQPCGNTCIGAKAKCKSPPGCAC